MISLQSKGLSRVFSNTTVQKHQFFSVQPSLWFSSHIYTYTTGRTIVLTIWTFVSQGMSLVFNMPSRFVIVFLPRNKRLLISWLQLPSAVILEPKKIKSVTVSIVSPSIIFACDKLGKKLGSSKLASLCFSQFTHLEWQSWVIQEA